ncbi:MAG TPA: hypothetical protein VJ461_00050 [Candidatus Nanoarchaeia archaeon]|nr:hypothetical protein [Candidatus Nanoarchaeia archaeon]
MSDSNFDEKAGFIVALFAAFIALTFSQLFDRFQLFFGLRNYPLTWSFNLMLLLLLICVYLYALDYIDCIKQKFGRFLNSTGNFFYAFSLIIFPATIVIHAISWFFRYVVIIPSEIFALILTGILGGGMIFFAYSIARAISIQQKQRRILKIQEDEEKILKQAEELYKQESYAPAMIEISKVIDIRIRKAILEKVNIDLGNTPSNILMDFALKTKVLNRKMYELVNEIRKMRNKAAHLDISFTKKDIDWVLTNAKDILTKLDTENKQ